MKFQILNNEQIGFYDNSGNLTSIIKPSGSNLVISPTSPDGDIELGQNGTVNDVELGNLATPVNMTFLGGGTITSNGNTLYIGDSNAGDNVVLSNVTIGSSVVWSTGLSGSFSGSHYGDFYGDGRGLVGITATVEPAGPVKSIQFNDNINNSGSGNFTFDKSTNTVELTGSLNLSGSATADFFFGNGAGLTGITSTFAPTGQDKSIQFNKGGTEISGSDGILFDYDNNNLIVKGYISASLLTGSATLTGSFTGDLNGDGTNITNVVGNTTFTGNPEIVGTLKATGIDVTGSVILSGSNDSEIRIMDDTTEAGLMLKNYGNGSRLGLFTSRGTAGGLSATGYGIHWSNGFGGGQDCIINSRNGGSLRGNNNVALQWAENGIRGNINFDNASTNTYFTTAGSTNRSLHFPGTGGQAHWTFRNQMGQSYGIQLRNSDTNDSVTILATSSPSPPEDQIIMRIDKSGTNGNYGGGGFIRYDATQNNRVYTFGNPLSERGDESGVNVKITAGAAGSIGTRNGGNVYLVPTVGSNGGIDGVVNVDGTARFTYSRVSSRYFSIEEAEGTDRVNLKFTGTHIVNITGSDMLNLKANDYISFGEGGYWRHYNPVSAGFGGRWGTYQPTTPYMEIGTNKPAVWRANIPDINTDGFIFEGSHPNGTRNLFTVQTYDGTSSSVSKKLIIKPNGYTEISGSLNVKGSEIDFTNLPSSDPGVAGRLFQTGSEAIGASPGFQVVIVSQG